MKANGKSGSGASRARGRVAPFGRDGEVAGVEQVTQVGSKGEAAGLKLGGGKVRGGAPVEKPGEDRVGTGSGVMSAAGVAQGRDRGAAPAMPMPIASFNI